MEGVISMTYVYKDNAVSDPTKFMIKIKFESFPPMSTCGSYNILLARIFDLSYADYLRMCRDEYGAVLRGKNCLYVIPLFSSDSKIDLLINNLNKRFTKLFKKERAVYDKIN